METMNSLRKVLWTGSDYDKGLNGKKVLIYGYHGPEKIGNSIVFLHLIIYSKNLLNE